MVRFSKLCAGTAPKEIDGRLCLQEDQEDACKALPVRASDDDRFH